MAKKFRLPKGEPLLDLVSYGRGNPRDYGGRLTTVHIEHIRRTVQRAPEVIVKVLPRASNDLKAAGKHLDYISRYGELGLETDDGGSLEGRVGDTVLEDWDLDIDDARRQSGLAATSGRQRPKLVHKLMFSMPPGTPPTKVLEAVRKFAREEFWGKHRYAFVLHTDEKHPHVHMVLKSVSEQGVRLNIKKATLRHWRSEFARNLRLLGVPANATERAVRGESLKAKKDGIYRASLRGDSTFVDVKAATVAAELRKGNLAIEIGKTRMVQTRNEVARGWNALGNLLSKQGLHELAQGIADFVQQMKPVRSDRERIAAEILERACARQREVNVSYPR